MVIAGACGRASAGSAFSSATTKALRDVQRSVKKNTRMRTKSSQRKVSLPWVRRCCSIFCKMGITGAKSASNTVIAHLLLAKTHDDADTMPQVRTTVNIAQMFCSSSNVFRPLLRMYMHFGSTDLDLIDDM